MDPTMQNGQDPEAIRRAALLAAIMGKTGAPGMPGAPGTPQPATPGFQIPNPTDTNQPSAPVAQPISSAKSPAAKPMATPSTAVEPGNQPPTFQSEEEWNKANPAAPHTPYVAPDLKHRLLTGLFAGMQEFGRPGEGAATVRDYLGNIDKSEDAEKNYADTSAAAQHQRYMTVAQGAEQPLHIQQLQAQIKDTEAQAADRAAQTKQRLNPAPKTKQIVATDTAGNPIPALQDLTTGKIIDQEGKEIPGAKMWEKPTKALTPQEEAYQHYIKQGLSPAEAYEKIREKPPEAAKPSKTLMLVPQPDGSSKAIEVTPGTVVPKGAETAPEFGKGSQPTADEQRRGDLANNMNENLDKLEEIVKRRPDLFGPAAGRWTSVKQAVGSGDPDVAALATIKEQVGMAMIGAHAMRNAQHVEAAADSILNAYKNEPSAILGEKGSIAAARSSLKTFTNDLKKGAGHDGAAEFDASKLSNFHTNGQQRIGWDGKQWVDATTGKSAQ